MLDDAQLLRRFVEQGSADAFDELARRHVDLVYSAALRQTGGDLHLAKDVTQLVLIDLARKARSLQGRPSIVGWLHTATRYAATTLMRTERHRRARETVSVALAATPGDSADTEWAALRPVLDEALGELKETEREAVLLRYFKGESYATVGQTLALSETAARSRADRALERLRRALFRRGIESTTAALGTALIRGATTPMPAEFASAVIGAALGGAAGASVGTVLLVGAPAGKLAALLAEILVVKTTATLLAVSLATNLALGSLYFARAEPAANYDRLAGVSMAPVTRPAAAAEKNNSAASALLAERTEARLDLTDQATLIRKMEQDGFDRDSIARAIRGLHSHWYRPQQQQAREERWAKTQPWNLNPQSYFFNSRAEREQRLQEREARAAAAVEAAGYGSGPPDPRKALPYLTTEKAAAVTQIEKDYAAISGSRSGDTILWEGPGRTGQQLWLEFAKDIRATLSPEEATRYFRDNSPAARDVQQALRQNTQIDVPPETYGAMVDEISAGTALAASLRKHLGDEQFLTLLEELDERAASADTAYRAAGVSPHVRAELFLHAAAAITELRAASPAARPALAQRTYDTLVRGAALSGPYLAAFDATPLGRALRGTARQTAP